MYAKSVKYDDFNLNISTPVKSHRRRMHHRWRAFRQTRRRPDATVSRLPIRRRLSVDDRTGQPFDYPGFKAVLSANAPQNSNTDDRVTPRVVGLISNRWGDFGALARAASMS